MCTVYASEQSASVLLCTNIGATNEQYRRKTAVIAYTSSKGHLHSLVRTFTVCSHKQ